MRKDGPVAGENSGFPEQVFLSVTFSNSVAQSQNEIFDTV